MSEGETGSMFASDCAHVFGTVSLAHARAIPCFLRPGAFGLRSPNGSEVPPAFRNPRWLLGHPAHEDSLRFDLIQNSLDSFLDFGENRSVNREMAKSY